MVDDVIHNLIVLGRLPEGDGRTNGRIASWEKYVVVVCLVQYDGEGVFSFCKAGF